VRRIDSDTGPWVPVPVWLLDAGASARAIRLYLELGRHEIAGTSPTRGAMATTLDCSEDTVDRAVAELVDVGALETWREGRVNRYRLLRTLPSLRTPADSTSPEVRSDAGQQGSMLRDSADVLPSSKREITPREEPPSPPTGREIVLVDSVDPVTAVFEAWTRSTGKDRAVLDDKRRKLIRARLAEGWTVADLCLAVTGWEASPHHRGENERATVYNDLALLLRDTAKVEFFIACARRGHAGGGRTGLLSGIERAVAAANGSHR